MGRPFVAGIFAGFGERVGDVAVLGGGGEGADGRGVGRGGDGFEEAHVGDVVEVDFFFEDYGETFAV